MIDYTLDHKINALNNKEQQILIDHKPLNKDMWPNKNYDPIKSRIKKELYKGQFDRCAYCRKNIEGDGKYEPLDHVVAKSSRPEWMFEVRNLVLTCDSCNNLKNKGETLAPAYISSVTYPDKSEAFLIFNPHFDSWGEHLMFEDDLFIVPVKNSKGKATISICRLYRYNIIINRAKELKLQQKTPAEKLIFRLSKMDISSSDYHDAMSELLKAMEHFVDRMDNNPNYA